MPFALSLLVAVLVGAAAYAYVVGRLGFGPKGGTIAAFVVSSIILFLLQEPLTHALWQFPVLLAAAVPGFLLAHLLKLGPRWERRHEDRFQRKLRRDGLA